MVWQLTASIAMQPALCLCWDLEGEYQERAQAQGLNRMSESLAIAVCNRKGGVGKTTVATHLAVLFSKRGWNTALLDCDPQQSSCDWAGRRDRPEPVVIDAHGAGSLLATALRLRIPFQSECVIYDAPVSGRTGDMADMLRRVQLAVVPVLPSPIDLEASERFVKELLKSREAQSGRLKVAVLANRLRPHQLSSRSLGQRVARWDATLIGNLRDTQLYVYAAGMGRTVPELEGVRAAPDRDEWAAIYDRIFRMVGARPRPAQAVTPTPVSYLSR